MAIFPQGKTRVRERANAGEKRVLDALARHLEDDYAVWHNIPIMGSGHEPDFVILHPQRGLLILEVKGWKRQTIVQANTMLVELRTEGGTVNNDHPVSQARGYMIDLMHQIQKRPELLHLDGPYRGKPLIPWGWGAVLSHIKAAEVSGDHSFSEVFEPHKVMLADDLAEDVDSMAFQQKLWGMFNVNWQCLLTLPQMNMVRALLFPELRMGHQQSLPLDDTPSKLVVQDVLQVMDLQQEAVARNLGEGHRLIHGPAGSGKTMILIFRAVQLQAIAREDKPILVLCYNRDLAGRIETMLRLKGVGPAVQVRTFHSWALDLIRTYQLAPISQHLAGDDYDALARLACDGIAASRVPKGQYAAILIDEAHDLADEWLAAAAQMVDPATKSLLVLYDDAQSIYQKSRRKLSFAKLGIEAKGRTEILKINYRNTTEVLALAIECAEGVLEDGRNATDEDMPLVIPQSAGRSGPLPTFHRFDSGRQEADHVVKAISELVVQGRSPGDIAVLARTWRGLESIRDALERAGIAVSADKSARRAADSTPSVKLTTLHSSKGLEFPVVFVVALEELEGAESKRLDELRLLYVGMTRATHRLGLTAMGTTKLTSHVEQALERVKRAYH
ncbi:MAG: hypothetical protein JWQ07_499 [Ramlibacter sp.]|nr:hypothetical protein [Ramlibacter sp.]